MPTSNRLSRIALAGNPNSGKTTLFNKLTGLRYKVGNYPGVTVEKKSAKLLFQEQPVVLVDLPGIYSLGSFSEDELIATRSLFGSLDDEAEPDLIIAVADASNLERNLFLITQLVDLGIPLLIALTMNDIAERKGIRVHSELLSRELGVPIVPLNASKNTGIDELKKLAISLLNKHEISRKRLSWVSNSKYLEASKAVGRKVRELKPFLPENSENSVGMTLISNAFVTKNDELKKLISSEKEKLSFEISDVDSFEAVCRYQWINKAFKNSVQVKRAKSSLGEFFDSLLVHRVSGLIFFVLLMAIIFQAIFLGAELPMQFIEDSIGMLTQATHTHLPEGMLNSLVVDGIITGVGNIIIFVPQIAILFFLLGLLEDSGYLSRAAFVMDRVMRPFGLQGRSFIPLLSSFACAIPGIMSTRTIASRSDRLATIMIAPLMSCSARLPVYTVLIAAFISKDQRFLGFPLQGMTLLFMYLLGVVFAGFVAFILKKTILKGEPALFLMEMPPLRAPVISTVLRDVWDRVMSFMKNAGTIILACSVVLWFLASFPKHEDPNQNDVKHSYAGQLGHLIEPVIKPLGFNWEVGIGLIASFAAREVFITTLATIYNLDSEEDSYSLIQVLKDKKTAGTFTTASAISLMVFYVFACQCMSTLAVCKRETGSWWWVGFMFIYMTTLAYVMSFLTYRILA